MPQELQVLRCYKCEHFQVHIVKKVLKWECKICFEKQSVKKVYDRGSGKQCRLTVQQLNLERNQAHTKSFNVNENCYEENNVTNEQNENNSSNLNINSKWSQFLDSPTESSNDESDLIELPVEVQNVTRKKFKHCPTSTKVNKSKKSYNFQLNNDESDLIELPVEVQNVTRKKFKHCSTSTKVNKSNKSYNFQLDNDENLSDSKFMNKSSLINTVQNEKDLSQPHINEAFQIKNILNEDKTHMNMKTDFKKVNVPKFSKWVEFCDENSSDDDVNNTNTAQNINITQTYSELNKSNICNSDVRSQNCLLKKDIFSSSEVEDLNVLFDF